MNDKPENMNTQQAEQEVQAQDEEKKFSQADVDRIVRERLKRSDEAKEKAHSEEIAAIQKSVSQRENRLACREYLLDNGYPAKLLDIIDTNDTEEFKKKADLAYGIVSRERRQPLAPLADTESINTPGADQQITEAFARGQKHKPKRWPTSTFEEI